MSGVIPGLELSARLTRLGGRAKAISSELTTRHAAVAEETKGLTDEFGQIVEDVRRTAVANREQIFIGGKTTAQFGTISLELLEQFEFVRPEGTLLPKELIRLYELLVTCANSVNRLTDDQFAAIREHISKVPFIECQEVLSIDFNDGGIPVEITLVPQD